MEIALRKDRLYQNLTGGSSWDDDDDDDDDDRGAVVLVMTMTTEMVTDGYGTDDSGQW